MRPFVGSTVKEHIILGIDKHDAEEQLDLWLSENPAIKVLKVPAKARASQLADAPRG